LNSVGAKASRLIEVDGNLAERDDIYLDKWTVTCVEKTKFIRLDNLVVTYPDNLIVPRLKNFIVNY